MGGRTSEVIRYEIELSADGRTSVYYAVRESGRTPVTPQGVYIQRRLRGTPVVDLRPPHLQGRPGRKPQQK